MARTLAIQARCGRRRLPVCRSVPSPERNDDECDSCQRANLVELNGVELTVTRHEATRGHSSRSRAWVHLREVRIKSPQCSDDVECRATDGCTHGALTDRDDQCAKHHGPMDGRSTEVVIACSNSNQLNLIPSEPRRWEMDSIRLIAVGEWTTGTLTTDR